MAVGCWQLAVGEFWQVAVGCEFNWSEVKFHTKIDLGHTNRQTYTHTHKLIQLKDPRRSNNIGVKVTYNANRTVCCYCFLHTLSFFLVTIFQLWHSQLTSSCFNSQLILADAKCTCCHTCWMTAICFNKAIIGGAYCISFMDYMIQLCPFLNWM